MRLVIEGGHQLSGDVRVSGSKNASLLCMLASLLTDHELTLSNVPRVDDIYGMCSILLHIGKQIDFNQHVLRISGSAKVLSLPHQLASKTRASVCVLGPLLAARGVASIAMPGGCILGPRPIDLHLNGLMQLGASVNANHDLIKATGRLSGCDIRLTGPRGPTVTGTANLMMAASLANGETTINGASKEPEVVALGDLLNKMGGDISGLGTDKITIVGVKELYGARQEVISDHIEAGTFIIAGALIGSRLNVCDMMVEHLDALMGMLGSAPPSGCSCCNINSDYVIMEAHERSSLDIITSPYPGFPTDLQSLIATLLTTTGGSIIENVFPERFAYVNELLKMGVNVHRSGNRLTIVKSQIKGAKVTATDIRGGAALILAGLAADGITEIDCVHHIDRGYESIDEKLRLVGAKINRMA